MGKLPEKITLSNHARTRLEERNDSIKYYNTRNLMKSSCKWYGKDDLIHNSDLYLHCKYTCKTSNQKAYMTDGNIEVIYHKRTKKAITILNVKDKFKPITKYIKTDVLQKQKQNYSSNYNIVYMNKYSNPITINQLIDLSKMKKTV